MKSTDVFFGWWVTLACTIIHILGAGIFFYGFSVFFTPMVQEFAWSSAIVSGAFALSRLEGGLEGPVIGYLVDRYGSKKLLIVGLFVTGSFFLLMPWVDSVWKMYLVYGIISIGYNTGYTHALVSTITNWFIKKRSRALMVYTLGAGVGGSIIVPILSRLITYYGWRTTSLISGISLMIIGLPLAKIITHRPEDRGLVPDGLTLNSKVEVLKDEKIEFSSDKIDELESNFTRNEAIRTRSFWIYIIAMLCRSFLLSSIVVHEIPHLVNIGIPIETAGDILGLMVFLSIPGRIAFGWAGDYLSQRYLIALACLMQCVGIFFLSNAQSIEYVYLFVLIYGIGYGGAIPLTTGYIGELFGRKYFASIRGLTSPVGMIGGIAGPIFAGYVFDVSNSYKFALDIFAIIALLAAITIIFAKKPKKPGNTIT